MPPSRAFPHFVCLTGSWEERQRNGFRLLNQQSIRIESRLRGGCPFNLILAITTRSDAFNSLKALSEGRCRLVVCFGTGNLQARQRREPALSGTKEGVVAIDSLVRQTNSLAFYVNNFKRFVWRISNCVEYAYQWRGTWRVLKCSLSVHLVSSRPYIWMEFFFKRNPTITFCLRRTIDQFAARSHQIRERD